MTTIGAFFAEKWQTNCVTHAQRCNSTVNQNHIVSVCDRLFRTEVTQNIMMQVPNLNGVMENKLLFVLKLKKGFQPAAADAMRRWIAGKDLKGLKLTGDDRALILYVVSVRWINGEYGPLHDRMNYVPWRTQGNIDMFPTLSEAEAHANKIIKELKGAALEDVRSKNAHARFKPKPEELDIDERASIYALWTGEEFWPRRAVVITVPRFGKANRVQWRGFG
jgi:hypothetical protein